MHFHDTNSSLTITRPEEHKRARLKAEEGVRLALEAIGRAEEEGEYARLDDE